MKLTCIKVDMGSIEGRYNISILDMFYREFNGGILDLLKDFPEGFEMLAYFGDKKHFKLLLNKISDDNQYEVCFRKVTDNTYALKYAKFEL